MYSANLHVASGVRRQQKATNQHSFMTIQFIDTVMPWKKVYTSCKHSLQSYINSANTNNDQYLPDSSLPNFSLLWVHQAVVPYCIAGCDLMPCHTMTLQQCKYSLEIITQYCLVNFKIYNVWVYIKRRLIMICFDLLSHDNLCVIWVTLWAPIQLSTVA